MRIPHKTTERANRCINCGAPLGLEYQPYETLCCVCSDKKSDAPPIVKVPETGMAIDFLKTQLQADEDYAWAWHCNIAMPMNDAGVDYNKANRIAANIMSIIFNVDTLTIYQRHCDDQLKRSQMEERLEGPFLVVFDGDRSDSGVVKQSIDDVVDYVLSPAALGDDGFTSIDIYEWLYDEDNWNHTKDDNEPFWFNVYIGEHSRLHVIRIGGVVTDDLDAPDASPRSHQLYEKGDPGIPNSILDSNGDVVLGLCKVCGRGEQELDDHPVCTPRPARGSRR